MALKETIDSNVTGLRIAEETSLKTVSGSAVWTGYEPNSYSSFGGAVNTVARNPIRADRQRKKGVAVGVTATGGFPMDLTFDNFQELSKGYFFADFRSKTEFGGSSEITAVDGTNEDYEAASGLDAFDANDLIFAKNFTNTENNGLKQVSTAGAASLVVVEDLVTETPPATATIIKVGHEFASGDAEIDASGDLPKLITSSKDLTELGLVPGEFIYIGGDDTTEKFATAANNGWARVRSIATNEIVIDKAQGTMVTDAGTSKTIRIFFGRIIKNESTSSLIVRRSYQLERSLGAPDDSSPSDIQGEYVTGAIPSEFTIDLSTQDIIEISLGFVGLDNEQRDAATGLKAGTRPAIESTDAFNTSSNVVRQKLARALNDNENPDPLVEYVENATISLNNNINPLNAVGVFGAFNASTGTFDASVQFDGYFQTVEAQIAVRNNYDMTYDTIIVKDNQGIFIDIPLIAIGDGQNDVALNEPVKVPLSSEAATGESVNSNLNHTMMMGFYDYLPNAAATVTS
jgi:hypothetical protein